MFVIYNMEASGNFAPAFGIGYELCDLKVFISKDVQIPDVSQEIGSIMISGGNI